MINLLVQLEPGGSRTSSPAARQVEAPAEPSALQQPEILVTVTILVIATIIWVGYAMNKKRSGRN